MLVITRKEGERIVIDDTIVITVIESNRRSVRIGVDAPRELSITRRELGSGTIEYLKAHQPKDRFKSR